MLRAMVLSLLFGGLVLAGYDAFRQPSNPGDPGSVQVHEGGTGLPPPDLSTH